MGGELRRSRRPVKAATLAVICGSFFVVGCSDAGSKAADRLAIGDCFVLPVQAEFDTVETQDCAAPHEAEIFAEVGLDVFGDLSDVQSVEDLKDLEVEDLPIGVNATGQTPAELEEACLDEFVAVAEPGSLPEDITVSFIASTINQTSGWCAVVSPSGGLVGSIVD